MAACSLLTSCFSCRDSDPYLPPGVEGESVTEGCFSLLDWDSDMVATVLLVCGVAVVVLIFSAVLLAMAGLGAFLAGASVIVVDTLFAMELSAFACAILFAIPVVVGVFCD